MAESPQTASRRWPWTPYIAIFLVALAVRFTYWAQVHGTPLDTWHEWDQTDMATYIEQGKRIAAGDWLARDPYHPYHLWQSSSGTESDWLRWYRPHAFHQAPLYSYTYALISKFSAHPDVVLKALQLIAGAGTAVILAFVARALSGDVAGIMTGLICALYGPLLYLECQILREGPALLGIAILLWLVVRQVRQEKPRWSRQGAIGAFLGVFAMFHEFALLLAVVTVVVLAIYSARRSAMAAGAAVVATSLGYLIGFSPLLARNIAAGASPLSVSSRPHLTIALANMPESPMRGISFGAPGRQFKEILDASGGSTLGVLREVWKAYDGRHAEFFRNWASRLSAIASGGELPDNTSFEFHRAHVPILAVSLTFRTIFPLGAAGVAATVIALFMSRRGGAWAASDADQRAQRAAHFAVLAYIPAVALALSLVNVQSRYRMILVPFLMIYSGVFVADVLRLASSRHALATGLLCASAIVFAIFQRSESAMLEPHCHRAADPTIIAQIYSRQRNEPKAVLFYEEAVRIAPDDAGSRARYAGSLYRLGEFDQCLAELQRADTLSPGVPDIRRLIDHVQRMIQTRRVPTSAQSDLNGS